MHLYFLLLGNKRSINFRFTRTVKSELQEGQIQGITYLLYETKMLKKND